MVALIFTAFLDDVSMAPLYAVDYVQLQAGNTDEVDTCYEYSFLVLCSVALLSCS